LLNIEALDHPPCELGENPLWEPNNKVLYWVDVTKGKIHSTDLSSSSSNSWRLPGNFLGSFALQGNGQAIVAMDDGFYHYDFNSRTCTSIALPEKDEPNTSFNDGKVDRNGQFIAGSRAIHLDKPRGAIYRIRNDGQCEQLDTGFICFNGPCWSPDGSIFYAADSLQQSIFAYDYTPNGPLKNRRLFASTKALLGYPDGATVDADGYLWSALFGAGKIARFTPEGSLDRLINLPIKFVSSLTFGAEALETLFVTSISCEIDGHRDSSKLAGHIFSIEGLGAVGIKENYAII